MALAQRAELAGSRHGRRDGRGDGQGRELIPVGGIEILGPLPNELQDTLVFAAAIMKGANDAAASKALVNFLGSPEAAAVIKAKGMEPG